MKPKNLAAVLQIKDARLCSMSIHLSAETKIVRPNAMKQKRLQNLSCPLRCHLVLHQKLEAKSKKS